MTRPSCPNEACIQSIGSLAKVVGGELLIVRQWACEQARYTVTATK